MLGSIEINGRSGGGSGSGSGGSGGGGWSIKTRSSSSCSPVKRFRSKLSTGTLHQRYTLQTTSHPIVKLCTAVNRELTSTMVLTVMIRHKNDHYTNISS